MSKVTRRRLLGGAVATAGGVVAAAIPPEAVAAAELSKTPEERLNAAISAVVDILREMNPDHPEVELLDQGSRHVVIMMKQLPPKPVEWTGPGFYKVEGKHPNGNQWCTTLWLDRVDYKTVPGFYYRAESWWKGRLEYARRLKPGAIRVVSRDDEYAAIHRA